MKQNAVVKSEFVVDEYKMIFGFILCIAAGLFCVVFGLLVWKKISLIHGYHYKKEKEDDVPSYTRLMGIGVLLIGVGVCMPILQPVIIQDTFHI